MKINHTRSVIAILSIVLFCGLGQVAHAQNKGEPAVIYTARKIITMEKFLPEATAVAVAGGRIFAVGSLDEVRQKLGKTKFTVDDSLKDKVLVPGFIDNHLHPLLVGGFLLQSKFITPYDWKLPSQQVKGVTGRDAYLARLKELEAEWKRGLEPG